LGHLIENEKTFRDCRTNPEYVRGAKKLKEEASEELERQEVLISRCIKNPPARA